MHAYVILLYSIQFKPTDLLIRFLRAINLRLSFIKQGALRFSDLSRALSRELLSDFFDL